MVEFSGRSWIDKVGEFGRNTQHYLSASGTNTSWRFKIFVRVFLKHQLVLETFILLLFQQKIKNIVEMASLIRFSRIKRNSLGRVGLNAGYNIFYMCERSRILYKLILSVKKKPNQTTNTKPIITKPLPKPFSFIVFFIFSLVERGEDTVNATVKNNGQNRWQRKWISTMILCK